MPCLLPQEQCLQENLVTIGMAAIKDQIGEVWYSNIVSRKATKIGGLIPKLNSDGDLNLRGDHIHHQRI